ncbi:MAG: NDP-hexose 3-C-methyltransferase TylCIII [Parcubacteria group bacterium GW2011_GWB1_45_9]|nr:MAG: NDP-hexose 3-C-methyltransferase TylCIII [Parcubacteria group bacterium GW2011_GWB1_45_9]
MNSEQKIIAVRESCRVCGFSPLLPIFSLGDQFITDFPEMGSSDEKTPKFPLELVLCNKKDGGCGLLQLKHTPSHEAMYRQYWYRSGVSNTMTNELRGIARKVESLMDLNGGDYVLDIGSNDSTLLRGYSTPNLQLVGFEPARNLMKYARGGVAKIINDFFSHELWNKEVGGAKAKSVTAIAMFYDLEDPNKFVADVARCLHDDGVFIIQMNALPSMLAQNAFDNIGHEHLEYYSLLALENLLARHNLEVFDVELNNINGGSFRTYIRHRGKGKNIKISSGAVRRLDDLRKHEQSIGLDDKTAYEDFVKRIMGFRTRTVDFINNEIKKGKRVYIYGASTRGNALLQFYGLDHKHIIAAAERNPDKWNKRIVGTKIPIISEEQARKDKPDYFLVLPWAFLEEFTAREAEFLKSDGKFIVPLPEFKVISA